jgi:hypothetical protein
VLVGSELDVAIVRINVQIQILGTVDFKIHVAATGHRPTAVDVAAGNYTEEYSNK